MRIEVCRYMDDVVDCELVEQLLVLSEIEGELFGFRDIIISERLICG